MALRSSRERFVARKQLCSWTGEGGGQNSKGRECLAEAAQNCITLFLGGGGGGGVVMYPVWRILGAIYPGVPGEGI